MPAITPLLRDYTSKDGRQQIVIRVEHEGRQEVLQKIADHPINKIQNLLLHRYRF